MTGITHTQAGRYMRKALDGLLTEDQRLDLTAHLDECEACRLESESLSLLTARLKTDFRARWDTQHGPSTNVMANIKSQTQRIIMKKRIDFAFNIFGGVVTLLVLAFVVSTVVSQFEKKSAAANETQTNDPVSTLQPEGLIAYVMVQTKIIGNGEIYTMRADGSEVTNLTNNPATDESPAWSPDGKQIAFVSDRSGGRDIYIMNADGSNVRKLTDSSTFNDHFSWSPDGKRIAYTSGENSLNYAGQLMVMNKDGSNKIVLTKELGSYSFLNWAPDGKHIAFISNMSQADDQRINVVSEDGNNLNEITKSLHPNERLANLNFYWSPNGQSIDFITINEKSQQWIAYNASLNGSSLSMKARSSTPMDSWRDGTSYITGFGKIFTWSREDGTSSTLEPFEKCNLKDDSQYSWFSKRSHLGNVLISVDCPNDDLWFYYANSNGTEIKQLINSPMPAKDGNVIETAWSLDDKYMLATIASNKGTELYRFDIQEMLNDPTIQPIQLATDSVMIYGAVWQPIVNNDIVEQKPTLEPTQISNDLVAFMAETNLATNKNRDIYTMRMDGSAVTNLTHDPAKDFNANDYNPAWSPDKKKIAFISDRAGNSTGNTDIFVMNPDGSNQTQLTNNPGLDDFLAWSPDGKRMAYYSSPLDEFYATGKIIIMNSDGSNKTVITQEPGYYYFQGWSPDGQNIVYGKPRLVGESFKDIGIHLVNIDGKNQHEWIVANFDQIHWEDSEHFLGVVQTGTEIQPQWTLYSFSTDGSQRAIATHSAPIAAFFENAYVIDGQDGSTWFTHAGNPIPAIPWNPTEECQATGDSFIATSHAIAPDKKLAFVMINCEKSNLFYLENEDGSKIEPLNGSIDASLGLFPQWSLDGKYVSIITFNYKDPFADTTVYLFDIEKMLKDPSTQPIQTTLNMTVSGQLVFGFPPSDNDKLQEQPTPKPLTFSLTTQQAKLLANFTVLEPSYLPAGYILEGMDYDPYTQKIAMKYISQQSEGILFIYQQHGDFVHDPAVQAYVTPVSIGDMEAEYIQGAWIYDTPETTTPRWDPSATFYSLTWQKGEIVFSIEFIGGETITHPSLADFVAIAESLK